MHSSKRTNGADAPKRQVQSLVAGGGCWGSQEQYSH